MAFANYVSQELRASAATSGTSEQDDAVTLPESVGEIFVHVQKTAEANIDNVLSVRLQGRFGASTWLDLPVDWIQTTVAVTTAAADGTVVTRDPNIVDEDSATPPQNYLAHYKALPTNVVRIISISSGTTPANTFSATAYYDLVQM